MDSKGGIVAGSHNRNEFVMIRHDGENGPKPVNNLNGQVCQICADTVGHTLTGEIFVACNECAFPVCLRCYDYEQKDGNQFCPQCKTRYKRQKGSPRVSGDEEEDGIDDLDSEFHTQGNVKVVSPWQQQHEEYVDLSSSSHHEPQPQHRIPRLTSGQILFVKCLMPRLIVSRLDHQDYWGMGTSVHTQSQVLILACQCL